MLLTSHDLTPVPSDSQPEMCGNVKFNINYYVDVMEPYVGYNIMYVPVCAYPGCTGAALGFFL